MRTPSSSQLVASWCTGLVLIAFTWWTYASWVSRERGFAQSDLDVSRTILSGTPVLTDSAARVKALAGVVQLQDASMRRILALEQRRPTAYALAIVATVGTCLLLLALTWYWAMQAKRETNLPA